MSLEGILDSLEAAQLLRRLNDAEPTYSFKNVLTQEAAYHSLLVKSRREIHRRIAQVYEEQYADRVGEHAALLVQHYQEAGDEDKTLKYSVLAGDRAARVYAHAEALDHYERALQIAAAPESGAPGELLIHLTLARGRVLELSSQFDEASAHYDAMLRLAAQRRDKALELAALIAQATIHAIISERFDPQRARELTGRALALAKQMGDRVSEAKVLWNLALLCASNDDVRASVDYGEQSLAIARDLNLREQVALALNDLARPLMSLGYLQRAKDALDEAREIWRALGNAPMLAENLNNTAMYYYFSGQHDRALAEVQEAYQIGRSAGNLWGQAFSRELAGYVYLELAEPDKAIDLIKEAVRLSEDAGFLAAELGQRPILALAYSYLGAVDQAFAVIHQAEATARPANEEQRLWLSAVKAHLYLARGDLEAADQALADSPLPDQVSVLSSPAPFFALAARTQLALMREEYERANALADAALQLLRDSGLRPFVSDGLQLCGRVLLAAGRTDEAVETLMAARQQAEAAGSRRSLWPALALLAETEARRGNRAASEQWRQEARKIVEFIAERAALADEMEAARGVRGSALRDSFLALPLVRSVLQQET